MDRLEKNNQNLEASIEALLFVYGEPVKIKKLAEVLEAGEENIKAALEKLSASFKDGSRGLDVLIVEDKATLVTKPELQKAVNKVVKEELDSDLSPASLETLAIVAYLGPVGRPQIDYIRGVNSSFILRNLMVRGLVQRGAEKDAGVGNLYSVTFDFWKYLGLNSQSSLPEFEKYRSLIRKFSDPVPETKEEGGASITPENK